MTAPERIMAGPEGHSWFWDKVDKSGGCWLWSASKMGNGYGSVRPPWASRTIGAHRVSWELHHGKKIPDGLVVMHSCDNPACVNPSHLSLGTQKDNMQQCVERGRHKPFVPATKTHCKNGHEYTDDNTQYVMSQGVRTKRCRTCHLASMKKSYSLKKQKVQNA